MNAPEVAFWLRWYDDWDAALRAGEGAIAVDPTFYENLAEPHFEAAIERLYALLIQAGNAPVPKSCVLYSSEPVPEDSSGGIVEEGDDWPSPGISREAKDDLRELIRFPYTMWWANQIPGGYNDAGELIALHALVRAIAILEKNPTDQEPAEIAAILRARLASGLTTSAFDFLATAQVNEVLTRHSVDSAAVIPFHRFAEADLSLERLFNRPIYNEDPGELEDLFKRDPDDCEVCGDWDDLCESCQGLQDAFDAEDDSYPGYYD